MARLVNRAEAWERAHEIFTQVNFNAFDYNTIKESLLDYVKLYYPEDFNDYIESSEFIAILELFAYVGELLAYRFDLNAHENIITVAERKESILRLAKLISYKVSRNIPARGLVKMTSISTTENVIDSAGRNLIGRRIYWNDSNNPDWKEQFILIMNRALEQEYGTVSANERVQVNDVLFELYTLDNNAFGEGTAATLSYNADAGGVTAPMEVVPVQLTETGPEERRPEQNAKFSLTYANDGLGDGSDTTGFLMFTKQGTLHQQIQQFDGVTPNLTFDIQVDNINETDIWLNNVNPNTGAILTDDPYAEFLPHLVSEDLRYGEWIEVDLANAQNIIFNTNKNRHKYEVETLDDDRVRLVFGDGEFSDIPSGSFQLWYRTSLNEDYIIEKTAVVDQPGAITYNDINGNVQTISFTFSLVSSLLNASASEDIEHIRRTAPSTYYTQDRMVNGRDYNTFLLQDPTILKMRAVNRTFAGDSKYISWHDPRESYENVKVFGDDLALYWDDNAPGSGLIDTAVESLSPSAILENYLEPYLSSSDFFSIVSPIQEQYYLESFITSVQLMHTLDNPNPYGTSLGDLFGRSIGISDNLAVVGAYGEDEVSANGSGKAYIFNVSTGAILHTLDNPNPYGTADNDNFGWSVAISGGYIIAGAPYEHSATINDEGKAYIFNAYTGLLLHTLDNPTAQASSRFGWSVAIDGNLAIVGATRINDGLANSGAAYIFDVTTGALLQSLPNPNAYGLSGNDEFGWDVSISGNYAIVGTPNEDDASGTQSGKAYIFNASTGALMHTLDNPNPVGTSANDNFGITVAIDGTYAVIGAPGENATYGSPLVTGESGKAYVYDVLTGGLIYTLDNPNADATDMDDLFGTTVSIDAGYILVGAPGEDDAGGTDSGKAYIFETTTGDLLYTIDNPNAHGTSTNDNFGAGYVSIRGNNVMVSSPLETDSGGTDSGKAYIFQLTTTVNTSAPGSIRTYFNTELYANVPGIDPGEVITSHPSTGESNEVDAIINALAPFPAFSPFSLWYSVYYDAWLVSTSGTDPFQSLFSFIPEYSSDAFEFFNVNKLPNNDWQINYATRRQIAYSPTTKFWNTNETSRTVNYDTLNSLLDKIVVLKANIGYETNVEKVLSTNMDYAVLAQELDDYLPDIHKLSVLPADVNGDGISDGLLQEGLLNFTIEGLWSNLKDPGGDYIDISQWGRKINNSETKGLDYDVKVEVEGVSYTYSGNDLITTIDLVMETLNFSNVPSSGENVKVTFIDHVYFIRDDELNPWEPVEVTDEIRLAYISEDETQNEEELRYDRKEGRFPLNFAWFHQAPQLSLIDPAATNIIDIYIITKGYYTSLTKWLENKTDIQPDAPTPLELRSSYSDLLDNKMISDTVVLHPGQFKILFGSRAIDELQAVFKVIRPETSSLTDNQVKARIVSIVRAFFDIETWEFGESFFFTELAASIHADLGPEIDSVVLVPVHAQHQFGDLFQVFSKEDEVFIADISTTDIEVVQSYTSSNIRQNP